MPEFLALSTDRKSYLQQIFENRYGNISYRYRGRIQVSYNLLLML
jgi:hypothetical protein